MAAARRDDDAGAESDSDASVGSEYYRDASHYKTLLSTFQCRGCVARCTELPTVTVDGAPYTANTIDTRTDPIVLQRIYEALKKVFQFEGEYVDETDDEDPDHAAVLASIQDLTERHRARRYLSKGIVVAFTEPNTDEHRILEFMRDGIPELPQFPHNAKIVDIVPLSYSRETLQCVDSKELRLLRLYHSAAQRTIPTTAEEQDEHGKWISSINEALKRRKRRESEETYPIPELKRQRPCVMCGM